MLINYNEDGKTRGLGLIDFSIKKLPTESKKTKLPNIGWKNVNFSYKKFSVFKKFNNEKFYFVHSFAIQKVEEEVVIGKSNFGSGDFISAIHSRTENNWTTYGSKIWYFTYHVWRKSS